MRAEQNILVYEGNTRNVLFELRKKGQRDFFDVSTASKIQFEVDNVDGVEQAPILADIAHPDADWANGRVIIVVSPSDVTATVGTRHYALTLFLGTEEITLVVGHIEVAERPGFPAP